MPHHQLLYSALLPTETEENVLSNPAMYRVGKCEKKNEIFSIFLKEEAKYRA
jgi:hypothetical protein